MYMGSQRPAPNGVNIFYLPLRLLGCSAARSYTQVNSETVWRSNEVHEAIGVCQHRAQWRIGVIGLVCIMG